LSSRRISLLAAALATALSLREFRPWTREARLAQRRLIVGTLYAAYSREEQGLNEQKMLGLL
jgi:hypothetical protein